MSPFDFAQGQALRRVVSAGAVVGAILSGSGRLVSAQNVPSFRGGADLVAIDVSVQQRGRPVTGLMAADFELLDNGVPQAVAQLAFETLPIDLTVAFDVSESVKGEVLAQLRRSVRELMQDLAPQDRFRLLTFNVRITRLVDFGAPASAIDAAFDRVRPFGATALRDAIAVALATVSPPERRQLVVAFSDGDDRSSVTSAEALLDVARHTTPTLGVVLAASNSPAASERVQAYTRLAKETGGFMELANADKSLGGTFRRLLADFRRSYVLYFTPHGVAASGVHTLDVRVKRPGVDVRARRGYSAK